MTIWSSPTPSGRSRAAGIAAATAAVLLALAGPCYADTIELPPPQADQLGGSELFQALGAFRDQLPGYLAPGPLSNDEVVQVEASGDGRIRRVTDEQRIRITGTGDYFVRESGPARAATAAGGEAPVLTLGDIVWQGFSTGSRQLAARIELDPEIESRHLPLRIGLTFTAAAGGRPTVLGPDRQVPGAGTVTLTVENTTAQQATIPTATDAAARQLATALDRLLTEARGGLGGRLPTTRTGIPAQLPVTGRASRQAVQLVLLQLRGTLSVGAGRPSTVRLDSLLRGSARFSVTVRQPGKVALDLTAVPALDPARLAPPRGLPSWSAWAGADPAPAERRAALDLLVQAAATGSRASAYSPYLGSQLETRGRTTFRYRLAATAAAGTARAQLTPRPVPISLAILGALALLGSGAALWRRS